MKPDKVIITLSDSSEEDVKVKVEFEPELPENEEDLEVSPALVALDMMLAALIPDTYKEQSEEEGPKVVH